MSGAERDPFVVMAPKERTVPLTLHESSLLGALTAAREALFAAWEEPETDPAFLPECQVCGDAPVLRMALCHAATCPPSGAAFGVRERHAQSHLRQGRIAVCHCTRSLRTARDGAVEAATRDAKRAYLDALPTGQADDWAAVTGVEVPSKSIRGLTAGPLLGPLTRGMAAR